MSRIRHDRRGIEGFPLQLLIIFIVIAVVVPLSWSYFHAYSVTRAEREIEEQFLYLETAVRDVYSMGPGNSRLVRLDIGGGMTSNIESVKIGGVPGDVWSNLSGCRYKISGQQDKYLIISKPNIAMINWTSTVEIGEGTWDLTLTSADELQLQRDIDGDGLLLSRFVEVGLVEGGA